MLLRCMRGTHHAADPEMNGRAIIILFPYNNLRRCPGRRSVTRTADVASRYEGTHDSDHTIEKRAPYLSV